MGNPRHERGQRLVFSGIVLVNLLLTGLIAHDALAVSPPAYGDLTSELMAMGYNLAFVVILLGFLAHETSKAYGFLVRAARIDEDFDRNGPRISLLRPSPTDSTEET